MSYGCTLYNLGKGKKNVTISKRKLKICQPYIEEKKLSFGRIQLNYYKNKNKYTEKILQLKFTLRQRESSVFVYYYYTN